MLVSCAALAGSVAVARVCEARVDRVGAVRACTPPLADWLHDRTSPSWVQYERCIDAFPVVMGLLVVGLALSGADVDVPGLVRALAIMFALRSVTVSATVLPSPICQGNKRMTDAVGGCHACVFSGHVACTLLLAHAASRVLPTAPLVAYCLVASFLVVATRSHYSVDVLVAWIVAYALTRA
jgi:hypothetical protein